MLLESLESRRLLSALAFSAPTDFTGGFSDAIGITSGDFNGDGAADIATVDSNGKATILLGNRDGTLQNGTDVALETQLSTISAIDLRGDGIEDLVVVSHLRRHIDVLLGNGNGTFRPARTILTDVSPSGNPVIADFNSDGIEDIAVAGDGPDEVQIFYGNGDGTFRAPVNIALSALPNNLSAADLNLDGNQDLILSYQSGVGILLGNGNGTFDLQQLISTSVAVEDTKIADFNSDGIPDLALADGQASITVLLGNGDGTFGAPATYTTGVIPFSMSIADMNGDGNLDILSSGFTDGFSILEGNGDGTFTNVSVSSSLIVAADAVDLTGSGLPDVVGVYGYAAINLNETSVTIPSFATLSNGTLSITGTSDGDAISVTGSNTDLTVSLNLQTPETFTGPIDKIIINAGNGNDTVSVSASITIPSLINGGAGDDMLIGGGGNDTLNGGGASDTIGGGAGNDSIVGGGGDDVIRGGTGNDTLWGGWGNDTLIGNAGHNLLTGRAGNDLIYSAVGATDIIFGGANHDTLHALGSDTIPNNDVEVILHS